MQDNYQYSELTKEIIGIAMAVHSYLGGGNFTENIYQRALLMDLQENGLTCESEIELPIFYKEKIIGKKRIDILVEKKILLELKVMNQLEPIHFNQVINYLKVFKLEVGLLLNFGTSSLQIKRFVNTAIQKNNK